MRLRRFCYVLVSEFVWFTGVVVGGWLVIGWMSLFLWDEFWLVGLVGLAWLASCALLVCVLRICIIEINICTITNV